MADNPEPIPADLPRAERTRYDNTGLSISCAQGRCGGCQHCGCTCRHHQADRT
jgi:hypothetical protein